MKLYIISMYCIVILLALSQCSRRIAVPSKIIIDNFRILDENKNLVDTILPGRHYTVHARLTNTGNEEFRNLHLRMYYTNRIEDDIIKSMYISIGKKQVLDTMMEYPHTNLIKSGTKVLGLYLYRDTLALGKAFGTFQFYPENKSKEQFLETIPLTPKQNFQSDPFLGESYASNGEFYSISEPVLRAGTSVFFQVDFEYKGQKKNQHIQVKYQPEGIEPVNIIKNKESLIDTELSEDTLIRLNNLSFKVPSPCNGKNIGVTVIASDLDNNKELHRKTYRITCGHALIVKKVFLHEK